MTRRCLVVMTKPPTPGRAKTRLSGRISRTQAADLHAALVGDLFERLDGGDWKLRIAWDLGEDEVQPRDWPRAGIEGVPQRGADLGERLFRALEGVSSSYDLVAAIGTDHPELAKCHVEAAFSNLLGSCDVVLGPAIDGGYYLIALASSSLSPYLFREIDWSTPRVLEQTLARCRSLDLRVAQLKALMDVDTPQDLELLEKLVQRGEISSRRVEELFRSWESSGTVGSSQPERRPVEK